MYYLLKIKGSGNINDFIQLRDEHFTLILCSPEKTFQKKMKEHPDSLVSDKIIKELNSLAYHQIKAIKI
jgi:molybdate-binding protein